MKQIHQFDNGIKVYDAQLLQVQRERYLRKNVHEEDEEIVFISLIKDIPKNGVYISVGTAIGYYPLLARSLRSDIRIHCFEPLPSHLDFLSENISLNGYRQDEFNIHPYAISTKSGNAKFIDNSYGSSLAKNTKTNYPSIHKLKTLVKNILDKSRNGIEISVDTIGLSEVFQKIGIQTIDLIQMDIQGFEEAVLNSYFKRNRDRNDKIIHFLIGTHGPSIHRNCKNLLVKNEYNIVHDEQDTEHQPDGILVGSLI